MELNKRSGEHTEYRMRLQQGQELAKLTVCNLHDENQRAETEYLEQLTKLQNTTEMRETEVK